ncbi:MAG: type II CAAX endopeptidase family protein [Clostridia bacterium]
MKKMNFDDAVKMVLLALAAMVVLSIPATFLEGDNSLYAGYLAPQIAFFFVPLIYIKYKGADFATETLLKAPISYKSVLFTFPVTVGVFLQNLLLTVSFVWLMDSLGVTMSVALPPLNSTEAVLMSLFIIAILPAIGEETLFRGVLVGAAEKKGRAFAIFVPALIFALMHGNPAQLVHQFLLGAALSYITLRTGSVVYAMLIHFFNNAIALTLPYIIPAFNNLGILSAKSVIIMAVMMLAGILILYPSLQMLVKFSGEKPLSRQEVRIFTFFGKKDTASCYNNNNLESKPVRSYWLAVLIVTLTAILILNTVLLSVPGLSDALA